jgi:hypothetical protein
LGAVGFGLPSSIRAANLLVNPGFEAPATDPPPTSSNCTGWTFDFLCERSTFHVNENPSGAGGTWNVWCKTFQPAGGGIHQDVDITPGTNYSLSAQSYFETAYPTTTATMQLGLIWLDAGSNPVGTPDFLNIDPTSNPPTGVWSTQSVNGIAPANAAKVQVFLGWTGGGTVPGQQSAFWDNADLEGAGTPPTSSTWVINASGDWNISGNWANGTVPNGSGVTAEFFGAITADHTVYTDIGVTAGTLNFNNAKTYVIGGAGSLTLEAPTGNANVIVQAGSQKINVPLTFASNTNINVSGGATLTIADPATIQSNKTVTKTGNVMIQAPLTIQSGGILQIDSGATSLFGAPALSAGAKVNVKNNSLTVDYRGAGSPAATIMAQLTSGYAGGAWNGDGINTSSATSSTGLGWKDDSASRSILVKYAYYGDANLDGSVDTVDFNLLAANFGGSGKNWVQGDFNYDSTTDTVDFNLLASNFSKPPLADAGAGVGNLVPEPASIGLLGLAGLGALRRRRR